MQAINGSKRRFLQTVGATAALGVAGGGVNDALVPSAKAAAAPDRTLRVAMTGGTFLKIHGEKYAGEVFTAQTGIKVEYIGGYGPDTLARLVAQKGRGRPPFDVWQAEDPEVFEAIDQGLVEKANPANMPHLKDVSSNAYLVNGYVPAACGIVFGLVYRVDKFKELGLDPNSWDVLWNPKLAGRVALAGYQVPNTQALLLAIAPNLGGNDRNLMPAIDALAKVKTHSMYSSAADLMSKVQSGEVWASYTSQGRAVSLMQQGLPVRFSVPANSDGTFGYGLLGVWSPVKGSPMADEAQRYIDLMLSPGNQLGFALDSPYAPVSNAIAPVIAQHPSITELALAGKSFDKIKFVKWSKEVREDRRRWSEEYTRKIGKA